jgi:Tannase and feruloyl esterase
VFAAVITAAAALAGSASAQVTSASAATAREQALAGSVANVPTLDRSGNYLSYHDVALVSKGLAQDFYGTGPRYSYFDGCSQGGNEALDEVQRYPTDFNGVLAGAPASITTELNSVLHEYTFEANYTKAGYSGSTILDQPEATILLNAAIKACDPKTGLILDNQACERTFNLNSVECSAKLKANCLTAAQLGVVRKVLAEPVDTQGQLLYPVARLLPGRGPGDGRGRRDPAVRPLLRAAGRRSLRRQRPRHL